MPYRQDPTGLDGDELDRWYRRSPQDVEWARQAAANQRYDVFFGGPDGAWPQDGQPTQARIDEAADGDNGALWVATGSGGYRAIRPNVPDYQAALEPIPPAPPGLPQIPAEPEFADLIEIGNPYNPKLRREWEAKNGRPWPKTEDGRNFHVAHGRGIADGGSNTLDNIKPMHPDQHFLEHLKNGDFARWGARASIAKAFGGRVEPPTPSPRLNGFRLNALGLLGFLPDITGMLSGRIRTDTTTHFLYDMANLPDPADQAQAIDPICKCWGVAKPGLRCA